MTSLLFGCSSLIKLQSFEAGQEYNKVALPYLEASGRAAGSGNWDVVDAAEVLLTPLDVACESVLKLVGVLVFGHAEPDAETLENADAELSACEDALQTFSAKPPEVPKLVVPK